MYRSPTRSLFFQSRQHAFVSGPDEVFRSTLPYSRECLVLALLSSTPQSLINVSLVMMGFWDHRDVIFLLSGEGWFARYGLC